MIQSCAAIVIAAKHHELIKVKDTRGTTHTVGALRCRFEFRTADWDYSAKTAMFCNGDAILHPEVANNAIAVPLDEDNECAVPYEVLTDTLPYSIGVWGATEDGLRIVSRWLVFGAQPGCYTDANAPADPEPTIYEQILSTSQNAVNVANKVMDMANNGEFDGVSATHEWNGTTLTITSASGTSSTDLKGEKGDMGPAGPQGEDGYTPIKGKDYFDGAPGKDGINGLDGKDGMTPHIGANGNWWIGNTDTGIKAEGKDGAPGKDGVDGVPGKDGINGEDGRDGVDGKSAYDIAKNNGFDGTEKEWLDSLIGEDGADGENGVGISSIEFNDNNEMLVTMTDGTVKNVGKVMADVDSLVSIFAKKEDVKQSDWNQSNETETDYIKNKPDIDGMIDAANEAVLGAIDEHVKKTNNPHGVTKEQIGLGAVVNTGDSETPVSGGTTKFTTGGAYTELNKKIDKTGGTISGDLVITGDLTVSGKTISEEHQAIVVEDNMIVINSNKVDLQTTVSGLAINKNESSTYGVVYDPTDDTFKFGEGTLSEENEFSFNEGEGLPFAVRDDSSKFVDGDLVQWGADGNKLVDSGKKVSDMVFINEASNETIENLDVTTKETVKTGWLEDNNGEKFAPKTLISQVQTNDGTLLDDIVESIEESLDTKTIKGTKITNSDTAYVKDVPENSAGYAKIEKIGGMTRKSVNLVSDTMLASVSYSQTEEVLQFDNALVQFNLDITFKAGTQYTLAYSATSKGSTGNGRLCFFYTDGSHSGSNIPVDDAYHTVVTVSDAGKTIKAIGKTFGSGGSFFIKRNSTMLNEGSTALPYESYFDGLRSAPVTSVDRVGINLTTAYEVYKNAHSYLETDVDGRRCIRMTSGEITKNTPFEFKKNTQYTVTFYTKSENYNNGIVDNIVFTFFYSDKTYSYVYASRNNTSWTKLTLTSDAGKTVIAVGVYASEYRVYNYIDIDTFMLNEGTTAIPYTPYIKRTLPIPEAVRNLDGYGWGINENFYNYIDWEKKQFVKRVDRVDMGMLSWIPYGNEVSVFQVSNPPCPTIKYGATPLTILNERFVSTGYNDRKSQDRTLCSFSTDAQKLLLAYDTAYTDAAAFKSAMSGVMLYYELATPVVTDISDILTISNALPVEAGGTVTMVNEYDHDVPSTIDFYEGANEIVGADTFVGDLVGTAGRAIADENGNRIDVTAYAPSGYGLGENEGRNIIDLNTATKVGFYMTAGEKTENAPDMAMKYSAFLVQRRGRYVYQTLYSADGYADIVMVTRCSKDGGTTWKEWEYINPPMKENTEYRTTERMNGKAVYKKRLESGAIQYRLDGETEWKDYAPVLGAALASHSHTKSQITDFPSSMPASDVYAWAKAENKPSYTASEVGAVPTARTINNKALSSNITLSYSDVGAAATSHGNHVPTKETANNKIFLRNDNTWQEVTPANIGAAPAYTYGTDDLTAGSSALETGKLYFVYE